VAKKGAGAITQHIGASEIPIGKIKETCLPLLEKMRMKLAIPGLLFIDTPGHESFTHLRKRGGSIADIAILVVDILSGFQPQTIESIKILREFKTPFIVAANKVDLISGWKPDPRSKDSCSIVSDIYAQKPEVQSKLDELVYSIVAKLSELGFESERFDRVSDFTRQVAIVPVSAKTGEGLPELLLSIAGLSQRFLEKSLETDENSAGMGSILEVKEEKGLGTTIDVILYEGVLRKNDEIIFGTVNGAAKAKVRGILKPKLYPKGENDRFEYVDEVRAAAGVKIYATGLEGALAGSPLLVDDGNPKTDQLREIEEMIKGILVESEEIGVIVKADTLGSVEAMHKLLAASNVKIKKAGVGRVTKKDVVDASVVKAEDTLKGVVLAFNVGIAEDAQEEAAKAGVKIFSSNVIYTLCEDYAAWIEEEKAKSAKAAEERLPMPAKLLVLPGCIFRSSKPAIFGVEVLDGRLKKGVRLMDRLGNIVGEAKEFQKDGKPLPQAVRGEQVAISVEGAVCGKSFAEGDVLYVYITESEGRELLECCSLSEDERRTLEEILSLTRKERI
jgi:translation initiation factor 5B